MNSPRYAPAGLLIEQSRVRVAIDGGPGADPAGPLAAWLVTDERAELIRELRRLAAAHGLVPAVSAFHAGGLMITPLAVVHTSHPAYGYLIEAGGRRTAWAPEFLEFPSWAAGADLMFAEAAGWARPIRFAKGTGGHAPALEVAEQAARHGVRRLVFAHIGRPAIAALDAGHVPALQNLESGALQPGVRADGELLRETAPGTGQAGSDVKEGGILAGGLLQAHAAGDVEPDAAGRDDAAAAGDIGGGDPADRAPVTPDAPLPCRPGAPRRGLLRRRRRRPTPPRPSGGSCRRPSGNSPRPRAGRGWCTCPPRAAPRGGTRTTGPSARSDRPARARPSCRGPAGGASRSP